MLLWTYVKFSLSSIHWWLIPNEHYTQDLKLQIGWLLLNSPREVFLCWDLHSSEKLNRLKAPGKETPSEANAHIRPIEMGSGEGKRENQEKR